jgi:DNA-binding FadR family transcriptional regulator
MPGRRAQIRPGVRAIAGSIRSGPVDSRLATERELTTMFNTRRRTIREPIYRAERSPERGWAAIIARMDLVEAKLAETLIVTQGNAGD